MMLFTKQNWSILFGLIVQIAITVKAEDEYSIKDWGYHTRLGDEVRFTCNDTQKAPDSNTTQTQQLRWFSEARVPLIELTSNQSKSEKFEFEEADGLSNMFMTIKNIENSDSGMYRCMVYHDDEVVLIIRKSLNLGGPLYDNLIDKYLDNIRIGGISAAIFFVIAVFTGGIYTFRYRENKSEVNIYKGTRISPENAYDNQAMEIDDGVPSKNGASMEGHQQATNNVHNQQDTKF